MGSGLAQPNMLNKPVDPMNTQKLKRCTMACNLECFTQAHRRPQATAASSVVRLGAANLRRSWASGTCEHRRRAGRAGRRAPQPSCGRCPLRDPPLRGRVLLSAATAVRAGSTSSIAMRPGRQGLSSSGDFPWSWTCRSLEEMRLEAKRRLGAVVRKRR